MKNDSLSDTIMSFLPIADPSVPNVQVTRLTLMCDQAPGPITMDLTGKKDYGMNISVFHTESSYNFIIYNFIILYSSCILYSIIYVTL